MGLIIVKKVALYEIQEKETGHTYVAIINAGINTGFPNKLDERILFFDIEEQLSMEIEPQNIASIMFLDDAVGIFEEPYDDAVQIVSLNEWGGMKEELLKGINHV